MMLKEIILGLCLFTCVTSQAQLPYQPEAEPIPDSVYQKRKLIVGVGGTALYTGIITYLGSAWYEQAGEGFRFFNDMAEWKQVDKVGHVFSGYHFAYNMDMLLRWSGVAENKAPWLAAGIAFVGTSTIEVLDGFAVGYGASWGDTGANLLGIGIHLAQRNFEFPFLTPKLSFHSTPLAQIRPEVLGSGPYDRWLKDYNGQTHWFALNFHHPLAFWPDWITLDLGYGAYNMIYARDSQNQQAGYSPYRIYYLSAGIDWNFISDANPKLGPLVSFLNMIKIPFPTMSWDQQNGVRFYPFYF